VWVGTCRAEQGKFSECSSYTSKYSAPALLMSHRKRYLLFVRRYYPLDEVYVPVGLEVVQRESEFFLDPFADRLSSVGGCPPRDNPLQATLYAFRFGLILQRRKQEILSGFFNDANVVGKGFSYLTNGIGTAHMDSRPRPT